MGLLPDSAIVDLLVDFSNCMKNMATVTAQVFISTWEHYVKVPQQCGLTYPYSLPQLSALREEGQGPRA